jgi:hypothetical protein
MHQQIRVRLASPSSVQDGSGAMAVMPVEVEPREVEAGALLRLLTLLADEGYNLRMAGGKGIETGGEFIFAIDDKGDEDAATRCAAFLEEHGYRRRVRVVEPFNCEVADEVRALHDCLASVAREGGLVDEIFVGTPRGKKVPIHVTSVQNVGRLTAS